MKPLTRDGQVVAAVRAGHTYAEVARKFPGLTRNAVSGIVWRTRLPPRPPRPPPHRPNIGQSMYDMPVLVLLADGKERTTREIAAAVGGHRDTVYRVLKHLLEEGSVCSAKLVVDHLVYRLWREAPEA